MKNEKFSLLSQIDNIIENDCVNNDIYEYYFTDIKTIITNNVCHDTYGHVVHVILYLDELIVEIMNDDKVCYSYTLPYIFIDNFHLIGGED